MGANSHGAKVLVNRLIREDNRDFGKTYLFTYDNKGNILSKKIAPFTLCKTNEILSFEEEISYGYDGDRLLQYKDYYFYYGEHGETKVYKNVSLDGQDCIISNYNGNTFKYNAKYQRTHKNNTRFVYGYDGNLLKQGDWSFNYVEGDRVGFYIGTVGYIYRKNAQGDVIAILDNHGEVVVKYAYDAWGNHKAYCFDKDINDYVQIFDSLTGVVATGYEDNVGLINPFRYRGYYYDVETGLYYLQSRYYDPEVGRFISPDSVDYLDPDSINGLNLYAYCGNNPTMYADPSGHSPEWWQWLINGATTALGIALCFVPGGQVFGAGLIVSGVSGLVANTMDAIGLDSELAMKIQSGLNVIGGIGLSFVPGLGALGASMIGAGVLSFAGGYISEALGGSYALGWGIGNVVGSIAGGMVYKGIVNKISTPSNMIKSFENHPNRWKLTGSEISDATGRSYRGGISNYSHYRNIWTRAQMGTHTITVNDIIKHFHYFF